MNINFNKLFQNIKQWFYIFLISYIIGVVLFFYLPKNGVSFIDDNNFGIEYKKYNFYSTLKKLDNNGKVIEEKTKEIQSLSKYDLKGIYLKNEIKGWIIIEDKAGTNSFVLSQGEQIDGYVLFKLYKNYVIFQKDKKEYKLEMLEKQSSNIESLKNETKDEIIVKNNGALVSREYLNSFTTNLEKIWSNVSINEVNDGEKINGFKIERINKDSAFSKLGLKEGDTIKSVNNNVLSSNAEAFKIFNDIKNIKYLNLEILRNNEILELNYEID